MHQLSKTDLLHQFKKVMLMSGLYINDENLGSSVDFSLFRNFPSNVFKSAFDSELFHMFQVILSNAVLT